MGIGISIGDWGLGIGDWAQSPIPKPPSPIPNPQLKNFIFFKIKLKKIINKFKKNAFLYNQINIIKYKKLK